MLRVRPGPPTASSRVTSPERVTLTLAHSEAAFLAGYLRVLAEWDMRACVRLVSRGKTLGVFGAPPTGCMSFIAIPLVIAPEPMDFAVIAGRFRDVLGDLSTPSVGPREVPLPESVSTPMELITLPPGNGWSLDEAATVEELTPVVDAALAEFKRRIPLDESVNSDQAQRVAQEIWSRPGLGQVPLRSLHTARSLGMLNNPEATVQAATTTGWTRLATPSGQLFATDDSGNLGIRLALLQ